MVFQSAMNALNPVMRVGDQFVDMMRAHEPDLEARCARAKQASCSISSASTLAACARTPRAVRRDAPARDHRDGARAPPRAGDPRRADDRSRRRRAARDPAAGRATCSASSASRCSSSPTISRCCSSSPTGSRSCTPARSSSRRRPSELLRRPLHPYTQGLMQLVPAAPRAARADDRHPRLAARPREPARRLPLPPALSALRAGATQRSMPRQTTERPRLHEAEPEHFVACHLVEERR